MAIHIRKIENQDHDWVRQFLKEQAGNTRMVSRGVLHQCDELPGFIGSQSRKDAGLLTYHVHEADFEVVTIHTAVRRQGLGSALLNQALSEARALQCRRLWLITTNDNEPAIQFYKNFGLHLTAVHKGAIAKSRLIKPEIPLIGLNNIPIEDEIEFELILE